MTMTPSDPLLSKSAVAQRLNCSERTLERLARKAQFAPPLRHGKEALWFESVVEHWLARQREQQLAWSPPGALPSMPRVSKLQESKPQGAAASMLLAVADPRVDPAPSEPTASSTKRPAPRPASRRPHHGSGLR
ncbi:MAG: helix-turn-helix domain-containing protein [Burkholderiales bacterium]|jgi:predicted DNA-binding transcriptional regulator AlpA|nr:helix-turn-helix domain-containing protein [Burkholderiales bacterium]